MKKNRAKIILILLFIAGSVWALYPTYQNQQLNNELASKRDSASKAKFMVDNSEDMRDASAKAIKLGLDLRGGIYVTMEVDVLKFIEEQALQKDDIFNSVIAETRKQEVTSDMPVVELFMQNFQQIAAPKGKSLSNYFFFDQARTGADAEIKAALEAGTNEAVDRAIEIIRNRVDQYGLTEPTIQKQGTRRIIIELPGAGDPAQVHQLLSGTAQLEFKVLKEPQIVSKIIERIDKYLVGDTSATNAAVAATSGAAQVADSVANKTSTIAAAPDSTNKNTAAKAGDSAAAPATAASTVNPQDSARLADSLAYAGLTPDQQREKFSREHPFSVLLLRGQDQQSGRVFVSEADRNAIMALLNRNDVKPYFENEMTFAFSRPLPGATGENVYEAYFLSATPELTGKVITDARADVSTINGAPEVTMQMDEEGARVWRRVTRQNKGKQVAIVLDNVVYSAPVVQNEIPSGNSQITGSGSMAEANLLQIILKAGALPAPVKIIQEQVVGPSLGQDSIDKGTNSILWGFLFVMAFMALYYRTGGFAADIAVMINLLFTMAILATFGATLTLPGMAGLVLTVGMAVDGNVLIYERIREELEAGKSLKLALDDGYKRAFAPIFDGHLTGLLSAVILYAFGTGTVQGFAVTLMIGVACSLFTAIVITRVIFDLLADKNPELVKFG
ncbi:MAG TPA: protein translocase subunit SecD [Candidatus Kapabacteria bacterium]|nr:protein translocase subunit SecD [Candidatus Kapabacteria bacterium]